MERGRDRDRERERETGTDKAVLGQAIVNMLTA